MALPGSIQLLMRERIHSVEHLEALFLMSSDRQRWWSDEELATALGIEVSSARAAARWLVDNGLCRAADPALGPTQFGPDDDVQKAVEEFARIYEERRVEVLMFISRSAIARVRADALRTFAEAFRVSEKKKDG